MLSVNPGTYGRGTTAGFHQLLFKLHGQDQIAKEEVMTTVNKSSSKVVRVFILQIVFLMKGPQRRTHLVAMVSFHQQTNLKPVPFFFPTGALLLNSVMAC